MSEYNLMQILDLVMLNYGSRVHSYRSIISDVFTVNSRFKLIALDLFSPVISNVIPFFLIFVYNC